MIAKKGTKLGILGNTGANIEVFIISIEIITNKTAVTSNLSRSIFNIFFFLF
ncbi:hypothetical protein STO1_003310 [Streptococcus oralis subsp. tigurinus]|uniref:Uncharacterized protein n=1 Tax=Streptococcus oralis subsp. tigurinus TaxID=1077464 RepID=A0A224A3G3_STROR|nr:hypothetical protein STO1_003310 [Streptococcus oralis subsp. tigurinus]